MQDVMKIEDRRYQSSTLEHIEASTSRRLLVVMPTGSGKTVIIAARSRANTEAGKRTIIVVHRRELAAQTYDHLIRAGLPKRDVGVLMASDQALAEGKGRVRPDAMVQVAGIDTITRREHYEADELIVDEAHRNLAPKYQKLAAKYPNARHLGFTATPVRLDGKGLGDFYNELYIGAGPTELIADGFLSGPVIYTIPKDKRINLKGVQTIAGDYNQRQLQRAANQKHLIGNTVSEYKRRANGMRAVVFAVGVEHSMSLAKRFRRAGVVAEHLDGDTPAEERAGILGRLRAGKTKVVCNCMVLTEGWDMPEVKCAILARPTKSLTVYMQQAGRILRPYKGKRPVILDHAANALRFGFPNQDRDWKLDTTKEKSEGETPCRMCDECGAVVPAGAAECPECGATLREVVDVPGETEDKLRRLELAKKKRDEALTRIREVAKTKGADEEWVQKVYGAMFEGAV